MRELNALLTIAYRDFTKFRRDPPRVVSSLIFPIIFVALLGGSLQANLGSNTAYDFLVFTFTGVLAQTVFQSTAMGIISLIEDRQMDFSQEMFVSPISRYTIIGGKITGETVVSLVQGLAVVGFGVLLGVPMSLGQLLGLLPVLVIICLLGGAFGVAMLSWATNQRAANQIFPFIMLPQFFLAGVFAPIQVLPWYLEIPSLLSPLRYAVDLARSVYYAGQPEASAVVLHGVAVNLAVIGALFAGFLVVGTWFFVRNERNR